MASLPKCVPAFRVLPCLFADAALSVTNMTDDMILTAHLSDPGMVVEGNSITVADRDSSPSPDDGTDFGEADMDSGSVVRTFTIHNTGSAPLNLTGDPLVEIAGQHPGDFRLTSMPSSPVAPGESTTFDVSFDPTATGVRNATVSIANDDPTKNAYTFAIRGTGTAQREKPVWPPRGPKRERLPEPARLGVSYLLIDPAWALPGQQITVSASICNRGEEQGSHAAVLSVNGVAEQSQSVSVSPGACQQVAFTLCRTVPGTYQVSVDGMTGQFSILAPRTVTQGVVTQQPSSIGTAGILAIVAVMLVLIAALIVVFSKA